MMSQPANQAPEPAAYEGSEVLERFYSTLELVDVVAAQIRRSLRGYLELEDLIASGRAGLLEAARRFDPARGVPFRAYATARVRGAMIDAIRCSGALPRRAFERLAALRAMSELSERELSYAEQPFANPDDVSEAESLLREHVSGLVLAALLAAEEAAETTLAGESHAGSESNPEEALARAQLLRALDAALAELREEASSVVRRHYLGGERLEDIARDYGMSKAWASRVLNRGIARLARKLVRR